MDVERVYVEPQPAGIYWGASVMNNLFGGRNFKRNKFVATVTSPRGTYVVAEVEFMQQYSTTLDDLTGIDQVEALRALDELVQPLQVLGFERIDHGQRWNSRVYARPYDPSNALPSLQQYKALTSQGVPSRPSDSTTIYGVLGIVLGLCCGPLGFIFSILAISSAAKHGRSKSAGIIGVILSSLVTVVWGLVTALSVVGALAHPPTP
jgi:hypothetical protein